MRWALMACVAALLLVSAAPVARSQTQTPPAEPTRELAAGGLLLAPDAALVIQAYEVTLARDEIRAVYRIVNAGPDTRTIYVTFPLPDLDMAAIGDQVVTLPKSDPQNYVGAIVTSDGAAVALRIEQRAQALGLDVTQDLAAAGIPLFPLGSAASRRLQRLPDATRSAFIERGVLRLEDGRVHAAWSLKTTAFWRQEFAPARTTTVELAYAPVTAQAALSPSVIEGLRRTHCIEPDIEAAIASKAAAMPSGALLQWVSYQLANGVTWPAPAASFRLLVRKPTADSIIATCRKGFKVVGPTVLEWIAKDFYPDDDVAVLFVR